MAQKIKLFVSGQGSYNASRKLSPSALRIKQTLDRSKDGELFTTIQVETMCEVSGHTVSKYSHLLPEYHYLVYYGLKYWGKPATVAQLKRETEHEGHRRRAAGATKSSRGGEETSQ